MLNSNFKTYSRASSLIESLDSSFVELAKILRKAQEDDKLLYGSLMQLPGLDRRTAYYLIKIDRAFGPLGLDKTELGAVGWTKLLTISSHVTEENVHALLSLAKSHTNRQLKALMAGKTPLKKARVVLLYLTPKQYAAYAVALIKHGARKKGNGLTHQETALMKVIEKIK